MPDPKTAKSEISVTLAAETNRVLKKIKSRTGLSVSRLANVGLAFLGPRILNGDFVIVNGVVVANGHAQPEKGARA
jgi:hypothetical protein